MCIHVGEYIIPSFRILSGVTRRVSPVEQELFTPQFLHHRVWYGS